MTKGTKFFDLVPFVELCFAVGEMMILSLAIGGLVGELLNLEAYFESFGRFLKHKTGNSKDPAFTKAFVDASLVVCIGAMAIVGAINDGIYHKPETLNNISLVGSISIFCVGLNLLWEKKVRVANFLPSLVVAVSFALVPKI